MLSLTFNDNQHRYLIPKNISNDAELEILVDNLLRSGFTFYGEGEYLISRHKLEMEYRKKRDKEYPFRDEVIRLWKPFKKIQYRNNESVIPIDVSDSQLNRAYRIVDTILKASHQLKGKFSINHGDRDVNTLVAN